MSEQLLTALITLFVGMSVVFAVLGILYVMLLFLPMVNSIGKKEESK